MSPRRLGAMTQRVHRTSAPATTRHHAHGWTRRGWRMADDPEAGAGRLGRVSG
jgi:hypothetical protein